MLAGIISNSPDGFPFLTLFIGFVRLAAASGKTA